MAAVIKVLISLSCDGCQDPYLHTKTTTNTVFRRDLQAVRAASWKAGWRQFRIKNTAPMGDYCPDCQRLMDRVKPGKRGSRAQKA